MKAFFSKISTAYLRSWWIPSFVFLVLLGIVFTSTLKVIRLPTAIETVLRVLSFLAFLGIPSVAIWSFANRRIRAGFMNLFLCLGCLGVTVYSIVYLLLAGMIGVIPDGFADDLTIPTDIAIAEPGEANDPHPGLDEDPLLASIHAALTTVRYHPDASISGEIAPLVHLQQNHPDLLMWYLSANPCWRMIRKNGNIYAMRRWRIGGVWIYSAEGHYSDRWLDDLPVFDFCVRIGLTGKPLRKITGVSTVVISGRSGQIDVHEESRIFESHCVILSDSLAVEFEESSEIPDRGMTLAAISHLENEFREMGEKPSLETARKAMPEGSILRGNPSLDIRKRSSIPGSYCSDVRVNPREPGILYLQAFEVTTGTALSAKKLKNRTEEIAGWSSDPEELFYSNSDFFILEGDPGKPYAARFEVWFRPSAGGLERKLLDRVFRIEGFP